jgi:acetyl esterase/lipase
MTIHPAVAARFHLLDGIPSIQAAMGDPELDRKFREFANPVLPPAPEALVQDLLLDGPHGPVPVRVYEPVDSGEDRPALLWLHGGAFMFGDLDMPEADRTGREIADRAGAVVVSVDYRLAVDGVHFPVPLDDCVAAARWLRDHAAELGVDPGRVNLGGASAGGNLATATALRLRDEDGWQPHSLIAVYPVLHDALPEPTPEVAAALDDVPPVLRFTPPATAGINANYLGGQPADGYSFPALSDVAGLAPTLVVVAEYDDLRTSGEAFADQLEAAGVDVGLVLADSMLHGFLNLAADLEPVDRVLELMAASVAATTTVPAT